MRTSRNHLLYGISISVGCVLSAGIWHREPNESLDAVPKALAQSMAAALWLVFDPANCEVKSGVVEWLNSLYLARAVQVHGVILRPPDSKVERAALLDAFNIRFPVQFDEDGEWTATLRHLALPAGVVALSVKGRVTLVYAVDGMDAIVDGASIARALGGPTT